MNNSSLQSTVRIRSQLSAIEVDNGQITGTIVITNSNIDDLKHLAENSIIEDTITFDGKTTIAINKVILNNDQSYETQITLLTQNLVEERYYEHLNDFLSACQYLFPNYTFYIHDLKSFSTDFPLNTELLKFKDVLQLIDLLTLIADFTQENTGEPKTFMFFDKKKLIVPLIFNRNHCRLIPYLDSLRNQLTSDHDKDQRITIFKNEMISSIFEFKEDDRFGNLLFKLDEIYDSYLKSHLLYIEQFSYHDLKSEIDEDKLEYTKKIYNTVNDVQTKLIAVPAAFLLVLSQFDFTGENFYKNLFITIGSLLFSILLEILLSNQFGLLRYIEKEIVHFTNQLKNKETSIDLSEFIRSFADLDPIVISQRCYLWIFRIVVWSVPLLSLTMMLIFK